MAGYADAFFQTAVVVFGAHIPVLYAVVTGEFVTGMVHLCNKKTAVNDIIPLILYVIVRTNHVRI